MDPLVELGPELTAAEAMRYDRQMLLPELAVDGQRRLKGARVLVVGAGGLGSSALTYLVAAGVGTVGIVDADRVELSNLHRQVLHETADLGQAKVDSAAARLRAINPQVSIRTHHELFGADNALKLVSGYDVVVDGTDNFGSRYLINDACVLAGKPCVWASILRFDAQVTVFWAGVGPCYRCIFPQPPGPGEVPSCAEGGVLGVLPGVIGTIQATETVKLLTGLGEALVGRMLLHDAAAQTWQNLPLVADPQCPVCGESPTITSVIESDPVTCEVPSDVAEVPDPSISVEELAADLRDRSEGRRTFALVDLRERHETAGYTIPGAVTIPKSVLDSGRAVLPEGSVILYCRSGQRSAMTLAAARAAGRDDVAHLRGGVLAWQAHQTLG